MKLLHSFTARLVLLLCIGIGAISCQEEGIVRLPAPMIEGGSHLPMSMVSLPIQQSLELGKYTALIGNTTMPVVVSQNELHFTVPPNLAAGDHTLQLHASGTSIAVQINVEAPQAIANAMSVIEQKAKELTGAQSQVLFKELMQRAADMTSLEQEQLALFLQANPQFIKRVNEAVAPRKTSTSPSSLHSLAVGSSITTTVTASEAWNSTSVQLVTGARYQVEATGTWTDWYIDCDANGYSQWHMVAFNWLKRDTGAQWFQLMGGYGKGSIFKLGKSTSFTACKNATLHLFANDAWGFYWNNYGSIQVKITRVQ